MPASVIVSEIGRKIAALKHPWLMIVSIALCLPIIGRPVIRSMATCWKGWPFSDTGILYSEGFGQCVQILDSWQTAHPYMYCSTHLVIDGQ